MLVVGINGSPIKDGNTFVLIDKMLKVIGQSGCETMIINAQDAIMSTKNPFCVACSNPCSKVCYQGTELEKVYEIMKKASAYIIGSPSYFGTVSAQLKAFFDKTRVQRTEKSFYGKPGAAVSVGASRFGGQETTIKALHDIMLVHGMYVIGDGYIEDDCGHQGVCAQRPSKDDLNSLKRAEIMAKRIVECIK